MRKRNPIINGTPLRTEYITGAPRTIFKHIKPILEGTQKWGKKPLVSPEAGEIRSALLKLKGEATVIITPYVNRPGWLRGKVEVGWKISVIPDRSNLQGATFTPLRKTRTLEYGYMNGMSVDASLIEAGTTIGNTDYVINGKIGANSNIADSTVWGLNVGAGSIITGSSITDLDVCGKHTISRNSRVFDCEFWDGVSLLADKSAGNVPLHNIVTWHLATKGGHLKICNPTQEPLYIETDDQVLRKHGVRHALYDAEVYTGKQNESRTKENYWATLSVTQYILNFSTASWDVSTVCIDDKAHKEHLNACRCLMWYPLYLDGNPLALEYIRRAQGMRGNIQNPLSAVPLVMLEEQMAVIAANIPAEG